MTEPEDDLALLESVESTIAEDVGELTATMALHLGTAVRYGGAGLSAEQIAARYGLEVGTVALMVPVPARPAFPEDLVTPGGIAYRHPVRLTKDEAAQAKRDARGYDRTPTVANSSEVQTCALPAAAVRMRARAEANGWHVEVLWGRAELAKRRKRADAEEIAAYNATVAKKDQSPVMEYGHLLVNSVSLRMGRGDEAVYAIWANGKWHGGGYKAGVEEIRGLTARDTETRIG